VNAFAPVLAAALGPAPTSSVTALVGQPSPTPSPSPESFSPLEVSPGLAGFIPVFLIALACIVLFLSLTRHLRRVTVRQAQLDAEERERELRDGPADAAGPDERGPATR
jgi:hypothetical protein